MRLDEVEMKIRRELKRMRREKEGEKDMETEEGTGIEMGVMWTDGGVIYGCRNNTRLYVGAR